VAHWGALRAALTSGDDCVRFSWLELDRLVGGLPPSAAKYRAWWSGDRPHVRVWRSSGYRVADLQPGRTVTFVRAFRPAGVDHAPEGLDIGRPDLVLLACSRTKAKTPAAARDLYVSPLFRKGRAYAERLGVPWYILSAEHALLPPGQLVAPYERHLSATSDDYRTAWGRWVAERLALLEGPLTGRVVELHAGSAYVDAVSPPLAAKGARVVDRLEGLPLGARLAWYSTDVPKPAGPPSEAAVHRLLAVDTSVSPAEFLATEGAGLKVVGLYSWWVDAAGADDLSRGLGHPVSAGLIYAGLAGATRWPSGNRSKNTLWSRIAAMHLGGNHEFSTFRRTLGSILAGAAGATRIDEGLLTAWMDRHLRVVAVPHPDPDALGRLEELVLTEIDPPLNLQGMPRTPLRVRLSELRRAVAR
jgi:hypothetical protein